MWIISRTLKKKIESIQTWHQMVCNSLTFYPMCFPLWFKWSSRRCFSWRVVMLRRWFFSAVTLLKQLSFSFLLLMHDLLFRTCLARQCTTSDKKSTKTNTCQTKPCLFLKSTDMEKGCLQTRLFRHGQRLFIIIIIIMGLDQTRRW